MKRSRLVASVPVTDELEHARNCEIVVSGGSKVKTRHHPTRPLGNRLSKSQDNLASVLRRKAAVAMLAGNKENMERDVASIMSAPRPKTAKITDALMRKCQSTQDIDVCDEPLQRTQSVHNICMAPGSQQFTTGATCVKKPDTNGVVPRRSASTRNINQKGGPHRISVPPNMMAYNAELLASFEKEKRGMERRISELIQIAESRKTEIEKLKFTVKNLEAVPSSDAQEELERLVEENHLLKNKLAEEGVSVKHFTDSEKLSLLQKVEGGCGNAADVAAVDAETGGENPVMSLCDLCSLTAEHPSPGSCDNANWERLSTRSSEATSEVAVANLQDRIQQMEETHYSTNEELQATLQELTDLQQTVNSLTEENEQLSNEKSVLLASLCAQTEKLENCRMQIEHMKAILTSDVAATDHSENERLLVQLIRSAEVEKEEFLLRTMGLTHTMQLVENENRESQDIIAALRDKVHILDMKNESVRADKKAADIALVTLREQVATDQIEIQRYKTLLENERQKVAELEQFRNMTDRTEVEELLDHSRQDKERLEERLTNLQEELSKGRNEVTRQCDMLATLEEQLKVCKNNAKTQVSDLEYSLAQIEAEKQELQQEVETLRDHIDQLQVDCDRFLEEKSADTAMMTQLEAKLDATQTRIYELEGELTDLRQKYWSEQEEWKQFQSDLQMAVVIANEIKVETEDNVEKLSHDNKTLKERCTLLEDQNHRVQDELHRLQIKTETKLAAPGRCDLRDRMLSTFDHDLALLTCGRPLSGPEAKASSVKNLIATIEKQVKTDMGTPPESPAHVGSRRNSADSNVSLGSFKSDVSPKALPSRHNSLTSATGIHKVDAKDTRVFTHRHTLANIIYESAPVTDDTKAVSPSSSSGDGGKMSRASSIRSAKSVLRRSGEVEAKCDKAATSQALRSDPLGNLAKQMGGSKRNALLKWCQARTASYTGIDITNFSSSWNDGIAFCALLHTYLKDKVPYKQLTSQNKLENFTVAFKAAESVGIPSILNISDMVSMERPDWQAVMSYVTSIYKHFEVDNKT